MTCHHVLRLPKGLTVSPHGWQARLRPVYSLFSERGVLDVIKGIGIDTVEIARVAGVYARYGDHFLAKVFTDGEQEYFSRWADPVPRIAGRFAAKEACMKALGTGWSRGVRWRDVEVGREPSGKPRVCLHGEAARILEALSATEIHCTITHSRDQAMAVVILE